MDSVSNERPRPVTLNGPEQRAFGDLPVSGKLGNLV